MKDESKTKEQLIDELVKTRLKLSELEQSEVTSRQKENQLEFSRHQLRLLIDAGPDFFFLKDIDFRYQLVNSALARFFGRPEADILGKTDIELMPVMDAALACQESDRLAMRDRKIVVTAERVGDCSYETYKFPVLTDGNIIGVAGVIRDITGRRKAEEALQKNEELQNTILSNVGAYIYIKDTQYRYTYVNEKVCSLFGYGRDEIIGKDDSAFFSADSLDEIKRSDCRVIEHGETVTREETNLTSADKVPRTYWVIKIPLKDSRENIYGLCGISTDITDLKRAEEALKRSESQLSSIIEFLPDATFVIDLEGKVIAWNRAIEQMTGVNKDTMLGQKDHACMIPFYGERRRHLMDLIDAGDPDLEARYDYVQKRDQTLYARVFAPALYDGRGAYLFATAAPLFDNHGKRIGSIESIRDITDYRQAEEELREAHTRLDEIIEYLPDATLVIDAQGKVIAWNKAIEDMTGVRAAEMIGRENYEYALPFYGERRPILIDLVLRPRAEIEKKYVNIERTDTVMDGEAYMPALRGGEVYLYGRASVLKDSKGNVVGAIESIHDITARRKAEEKYRSIFENAVMGIFHSTLEGRIISANPAFARILGYDSPEEVIHTITDMALQVYVDSRRRSEFLHLMDTQGTLHEQEVQFYKKDGNTVLVLITGRAVRDGAGKLLYYEGTMQDITERRRLESQLRQAQKMEAIGTLAGGIAHDFNNILASIMGYTEMGLREDRLDIRRNYLHQVLQACERAKNLVNQILSFSRQQEQERKPLDIRLVLKEALSLLRATLPTTIKMKQHIAAQESTVLADPTQIHQIIMNLCTNAAHAMREKGGMLDIRLSNIEIETSSPFLPPDLQPGYYVMLSVGDTGHGIDPAIKDKIFDPFFTTKKAKEGTGLGLSVVYGIVKNYGGSIDVQSSVGQGTTFTIYLPCIVMQKTAERKDSTDIDLHGQEHILFVDDEEMLVNVVRTFFETLGYTITATTSSAEALALFLSNPLKFDLVITDMTMPEMTGVALTDALLKIRPDLPVVLCTGYSDSLNVSDIRRLNIRELCQKPILLNDMARLVKSILNA